MVTRSASAERHRLQLTTRSGYSDHWLRKARAWRTAAWIEGYSFVLFAIILAYFALVIRGLSELSKFAGSLLIGLGAASAIPVAAAAVFVVVTAVLTQLFLALYRGVFGLVTNRYERAADAAAGITLSRVQHPELYAMVASVGRRVGAPLPDEIQVAESAACYVSEQRTLAIRPDRQLTLVLGMPHLALLTVSELKVILAHELAHFRSGDTRVAVFFYRFVETLRACADRMKRHWWYRLDPVCWFSKAYLHLFLSLSAPIGRHKELRADALSAEAYGGELASRTLLKEWLLVRQFDAAVEAYAAQFSGDQATNGANVFRWFVQRWRDFSPQGQDYLRRRLADEEHPSRFDSHPTMQQRIEAMQAFPPRETPDSRPAHLLLHDVASIEQQLQRRLFRS